MCLPHFFVCVPHWLPVAGTPPNRPHLVSSHIRLQQGMFLLEVLHIGQIFSVVVGSQVTFHFVQPELNVLHVAIELLLLVSLAQLYAWADTQVELVTGQRCS